MRSLFIAVILVALVAVASAQIPGGSSAREIPKTVEATHPTVDQIIERSNDHFRKGKLALEDNKPKQAREEFDKAIDEILMSGFDVRSNERLNAFYLELVERIHREEVPLAQRTSNGAIVFQASPTPTPVIGFKEQKLDPSNDRLSQPVAQPPKDAILVQGFWLGMDLADADLTDRRPANSTEEIELGLKKYSLIGLELEWRGVKEAKASGVKSVDLVFLDGRLTEVSAMYDDSVDFKSILEFTSAISKALHLGADWKIYRLRSSTDAALQTRPPFEYLALYSRYVRSFTMRDTRMNGVIDKRRADEKEKRRREFKP